MPRAGVQATLRRWQILATLPPCLVGTAAAACLIDPLLSTGTSTKGGYVFNAAGTNPDANGTLNGYEVNATPATLQATGVRAFCSDASGVVRFVIPGAATSVSLRDLAQPSRRQLGSPVPLETDSRASAGVFASSAPGVGLEKPLRVRGMRLSKVILEPSSTDGSSLGILRALLKCTLGP